MRVPRVRFTILGMMLVVAVAAVVINMFRPMTPAEAEKVAEARFLKVPGATRWAGRYRVHAWPAGSKTEGDGWLVDFTESGDGSHLCQMFVTTKGKTVGIGLAHGKFK